MRVIHPEPCRGFLKARFQEPLGEFALNNDNPSLCTQFNPAAAPSSTSTTSSAAAHSHANPAAMSQERIFTPRDREAAPSAILPHLAEQGSRVSPRQLRSTSS